MTRWFNSDTCNISGHQPGDRHWAVGERDTVWTGEAWTLVCPTCDGPMLGRTGTLGWLCCGGCGLMYDQVPTRTEKPAGVLS